MTEGGSPAREPPFWNSTPCQGLKLENQEERTSMRENSATPDPEIIDFDQPPLPDGAEAGDWQPTDDGTTSFRFVHSPALHPAGISATVCQYADGTFATDGEFGPAVRTGGDEFCSPSEARARASALADAADIAEHWAGTEVRQLSDIRRWARANGYQLRDHGCIPHHVIQAYREQWVVYLRVKP